MQYPPNRSGGNMAFHALRSVLPVVCLAAFVVAPAVAQDSQTAPPATPPSSYNDHQNMMNQLGVKALRPGANPNKQEIFNEANANPYKDTLPDVLTMNDGTKVTRPDQWPARRTEIVELFAREVYGRIPPNAPKVNWE